jgi:hypothetical protein
LIKNISFVLGVFWHIKREENDWTDHFSKYL